MGYKNNETKRWVDSLSLDEKITHIKQVSYDQVSYLQSLIEARERTRAMQKSCINAQVNGDGKAGRALLDYWYSAVRDEFLQLYRFYEDSKKGNVGFQTLQMLVESDIAGVIERFAHMHPHGPYITEADVHAKLQHFVKLKGRAELQRLKYLRTYTAHAPATSTKRQVSIKIKELDKLYRETCALVEFFYLLTHAAGYAVAYGETEWRSAYLHLWDNLEFIPPDGEESFEVRDGSGVTVFVADNFREARQEQQRLNGHSGLWNGPHLITKLLYKKIVRVKKYEVDIASGKKRRIF